jgi:hypothetical protein
MPEKDKEAMRLKGKILTKYKATVIPPVVSFSEERRKFPHRFTGRSTPLMVRIESSKRTSRVPSQLNMAIISP